jgi:hypothetical protein
MTDVRDDRAGLAVRDSWAAIGAVAAVVGVLVAFVQVYLARPSLLLVSALAGLLLLTAGLLIASVRLQRRRLGQRVYIFKNERTKQEYYRAFAAALREARDQIYYAGRGFDGLTSESQRNADLILEATREGLRNGATLWRIQTSSRVSRAWAEAYATLAEQFGSSVNVFHDLADPTFVNIGIYDPNSPNCVVQVAFEMQQRRGPETIHRVVGACFFYGNTELARGLQGLFVQRIATLSAVRLAPSEIRALPDGQSAPPAEREALPDGQAMLSGQRGGRPDGREARPDGPQEPADGAGPQVEEGRMGAFFNFAYGANIDPDWMRRRAPSARVVGTGWLRGWERRFNVLAPDHYPDGGAIAGIYPSEQGAVEGVVYEISRADKDELDRYEKETGYATQHVEVELGDRGQISLPCFVYVLPSPAERPPPPSPEYLSQLMKGAERLGLDSVKALVVDARGSLHADDFEIPPGFA